MKEISFDELEAHAESLAEKNKEWHFHMLTPQCQFNKRNTHAFVLENTTDNQVYVVYSEDRNMSLGKKLVKLLHTEEVTEKPETAQPSTQIQKPLERMRELNAQNISWHHHMFFPNCVYNKFKGKWNITFEDPDSNSSIELTYDEQPLSDLSYVEAEFYAQKK